GSLRVWASYLRARGEPVARVVVVSGLARSLVSFRGPLLARFVALGHEVVAMAPEAEAPAGLDALGVSYRPLRLDRAGTDARSDLRAIGSLAATFRELRPEVVLGYNVKPMVYAMLAAAAVRVPRRYALVTGLGYLFLDDGTRRQRLVRWVARPMYRAALTAATGVFVQNPDDERDLRDAHVLPRRKPTIRVMGSGIDVRAFPTVPVPDGPARFLFVGRLLRDKGVFEFVDAARAVRARHPEVTFAIAGGLDPNPSSVGADVLRGWERDGTVAYLGEVPDVRPHLRACTVFVLPSYREGTPRSVLEAMATGRAAITTDAPGCRETVSDGDNGLLVPVRDAGALAAAMERFVADPSLAVRMGAAGRRRAEQLFDVERVVSTMVAAMRLGGAEEQ
ncbi:MAG: glycosyltransferase family 4 protein, partial [Myxococcota bacterium]